MYIAEGKYPQWIYFVECDPVEAMPPVKAFFGPLNATLTGDSYASNEGGEFSKQTFTICWEEKNVICQVHSLPSFALCIYIYIGVCVSKAATRSVC